MNLKIIKLSKKIDIRKEAQTISGTLEEWQAVLEEATATGDDVISSIASNFVKNFRELNKVSEKISQYNKQDIEHASRIIKTLPDITKTSNLGKGDLELIKLSGIDKHAQEGEAYDWKKILATLGIGVGALWGASKVFGRAMPLVGLLISWAFFFKNLVAGSMEFTRLMQHQGASSLNLKCAGLDAKLCSLNPVALNDAFERYKNDPKKLKSLASVTKISKYFVDELISGGINLADAVKDTFFAILELMATFSLGPTAGLSGGATATIFGADIGASLAFMGLEYIIEKYSLEYWDNVLNNIKATAEANIKQLQQQPQKFREDYSAEELDTWWGQEVSESPKKQYTKEELDAWWGKKEALV